MSAVAALLAALSLVGHWWGHTRGLDIKANRTGVEIVDDGCCTHVYTLRFRIVRTRGSIATYRVTSFVAGRGWPAHLRKPRVGATGTLRLRSGVLTDTLMQVTFCAPDVGRCGA